MADNHNVTHKGVSFRSELEARWAAFFDALAIAWQYKTQGFALSGGLQYVPDFYLPDWDVFIKTNPGLPYEDVVVDRGQSIVRVLDGADRPTTMGLFMIASRQLQTRDKQVVKPRLYLMCGGPAVPKVRRGKDGRWELKAGHTCLRYTATPDGAVGFTCCALALCGGMKERLDFWTLYLEGNTYGTRRGLTTPMFPFDYGTTVYIGDGVLYDAPRLTQAFDAARAAQFSGGGTTA